MTACWIIMPTRMSTTMSKFQKIASCDTIWIKYAKTYFWTKKSDIWHTHRNNNIIVEAYFIELLEENGQQDKMLKFWTMLAAFWKWFEGSTRL